MNSFLPSRLLTFSVLLGASVTSAHAVGWKTQLNCASDYYAYCSAYSVGTLELRKCMRSNGPRLSKACVSALIADGEISAGEVEQEKAKIAAAKAKPNLAVAKKIEPQHKVPAQVAAEPQRPPAKIARAPDSQPAPKPVLTKQTVSLSYKTFVALKTRGDHFLYEDTINVASTSIVLEPVTPQPLAAKPLPITPAAPAETKPAIAQDIPSDGVSDGVSAQPASADLQEPPSKTTEYPASRMSLGRNLPAQNEEPSLSWWEQIVRFFNGGDW